MAFLYASGALAALWVFNAIVGASLGRRVGQDNHFFENTVKNGNNIFFCAFGVAGTAIANYLVAALKWAVVGYYGLTGAIAAALLVFTVVAQIVADISHRKLSFEWLVIVSNALSLAGDVVVVVLAYNLLW